MSDEEKKYRIRYLWFRVRTVYNMIRFVVILRQNRDEEQAARGHDEEREMLVEEDEYEGETFVCYCIKLDTVMFAW